MVAVDVKAVTFDGDQTLWDLAVGLDAALGVVCDRFRDRGLRASDQQPVTKTWLAAMRDDVASRPQFQRTRMEVVRRASIAEAVAVAGGGADEDFVQEVFEAFMHERHSQVPLYPDVLPVLSHLAAAGYRLGLITNGNTRPDRLGVAHLLDSVVVAADVGLFKPDPAIYAWAAADLGVEPEWCLHVGDHLVEDVGAATQAGMSSAWLIRGLDVELPSQPALGTTVVRSLEEVPALLGTGYPSGQAQEVYRSDLGDVVGQLPEAEAGDA